MGLTFLSLIFEREITGEIENHKTEQLLQINVGCFYQFQTWKPNESQSADFFLNQK